ncbi:MAG: amidophosphoribosyltransferase [Coriobacteriia bacterium]|nr:amidophosphoribosyltransferase [Coriobacteriia bacterium]MBN2848602.1 amidophosphoribosyltransferase [Coriobacteriia bacterium]
MIDSHRDDDWILAERPDHMEEECGVFGVYARGEDVARLTYFGLHALQHRGQESAGIAVADGHSLMVVKNLGLVAQVFTESDLDSLQGDLAVGHTRYSTTGASKKWENAQPMISAIGPNTIALAHNGNLVNTASLREQLQSLGVRFRSTTDSEVMVRLVDHFTQQHDSIRGGIRDAMRLMRGAYSVVMMSEQALYAFRDAHGVRPLCIGRLPEDRGWVFASETCALDIIGAEFVRNVNPGELIRVKDGVLEAEQAVPAEKRSLCVFEFVYFARPDSVISGRSVYESRRTQGMALAKTAPVEADLVIGVPDSGIPGAVGYAQASGIPYGEGLVKNRYVGRTFISPTQSLRQQGIRLKLNPLRHIIEDKRLLVVDDSIVRGNTSKKLVQLLRDSGAAEVHLRLTSPPVVWPCFYGIDTDTQDQLIASSHTVEQIAEFIGADSVAFLELEDLVASTGRPAGDLCTACFNGAYPIDIPDSLRRGKLRLEQAE